MKKLIQLIAICSVSFVAFTACANFLKGAETAEQLNKEFERGKTTPISVLFRPENANVGAFEFEGFKTYRVKDSFQIQFTVNPDFTFQGFTAVDQTTSESRADCVVFTDEVITQRGSYLIVSCTGTISNYAQTLWIQPVCSSKYDITAPVYYSENGVEFLAAKSKELMDQGIYIDESDMSDFYDNEYLFGVYNSEDFHVRRTNKLHIKLNAMDDNVVSYVKVVETLLYDSGIDNDDEEFVHSASRENIKEVLIKEGINKAGYGLFTAEFDYEFKLEKDGFCRLDFYLVDVFGNTSSECKTIYVWKDTQVYIIGYNFAAEPAYSFDYLLNVEDPEKYANLISVRTRGWEDEEDYCTPSGTFVDTRNLVFKFAVSIDGINYSPVERNSDGYIDISGFSRNKGLYVKNILIDDLENTAEVIDYIPYANVPVFYTIDDGKLIRSINPPDSYFKSSVTNKYLVKNPGESTYTEYSDINDISYVRGQKTIIYVYSQSSSNWSLLSDKIDLSQEKFMNSNSGQHLPEPICDFIYYTDNTLKVTVTNYKEVGFDYISVHLLDGFADDKYIILAEESPCFEIPNCTKAAAIIGGIKNDVTSSIIVSLSDLPRVDNTPPYFTTENNVYLTTNYKGTEFTVYAKDDYSLIDSIKLYYSIEDKKRTEEEILTLPDTFSINESSVTSSYGANPVGKKCTFDITALGQNKYYAYLCATDTAGNYVIEPMELDTRRLENVISVSDSNSIKVNLDRDTFYSENDINKIDYWDDNWDKWKNYSYIYSDNDFYRVVIRNTTSDDKFAFGIFSYPFYVCGDYNGSKTSSALKKTVITNGNINTIMSDYCVFVETVYSSENLGLNPLDWDVFTPDANKINCKYIFRGKYGTLDYQNYDINTKLIPENMYYCAIFHFSDGSTVMSEVNIKE